MLGEDPRPEQPPLADTPTATVVPITNLTRTANAIAFRITVSEDGWILIPERWARSWRAQIDGSEAPVWGAAFVYMALHLAQGDHLVQLSFEPGRSLMMLAFSWLVILGATIAAGYPLLDRHSAGRRRSPVAARPPAAEAPAAVLPRKLEGEIREARGRGVAP